MEIELMLKEVGLSGNESKLYIELLRRAPISANELSKKIGFDRTLTYQILYNLIEKGLVSYIVKENKKIFRASSPENLLNPIKEKEGIILNLIPRLKSIENIKETEQEINVYEGKKGLKVLLDDMIKSREIIVFGSTGKTFDILQFELPHLIKKAQKLGLKGRMITSKKFSKHPMTRIKGLKTKFLEEIKGPTTTSIYRDKISIHLLTGRPIIIIIKNKEIADSYKEYFEYLWKIAQN